MLMVMLGHHLDTEEVEMLKDIYPKVKPYLRKEGIEAIEKQGTSTLRISENLKHL